MSDTPWDDPNHDVVGDIQSYVDLAFEGLLTGHIEGPGFTIDWRNPSMPDDQGSVRMFCTNDACEVKDIRMIFAEVARCPECGATMSSNNARPQRQYRSF